jgi:hypothetical protein
VFESERGDEHDLDRDFHARLDHQAFAIGQKRHPVLADRRPVPQGAKAQVTLARGIGADGADRPQQWNRRCGRGQPQ